nr:MAG: putative RNA-dependent RNA polymerase [Picobirnavirus sp.]
MIVSNDFCKLEPYCSEESINYLKESLARLENGTPPTPSFPLYGKRDASLLDDARDIIGKPSSLSWLPAYEQSREVKFGSQGGVPKWADLKDNFEQYQSANKPVKYVDPDVLREMRTRYKSLRCAMLSASEALEHLKKTDKIETRAAGWSEFQLKKTDVAAQICALKYLKNGLWKFGYGYVFARFNKQKMRIFMPMPYSSMIGQAQYFIPFMTNIQASLLTLKDKSPYVFWSDKVGFENCFSILETELNSAGLEDDEIIVYFSNDFEKMDTRTATEQYDSIYLPVFRSAFGDSHSMDDIVRFTTTAPIISPSGTMIGDHGTASGAELTNCGETVINEYFQNRMLKILRERIPNAWRIITKRGNGDDSITIFAIKKSLGFARFEETLRDVLLQVCDETGYDVQTEKLDISTEFGKYCQNVLSYDRATRKLAWCYPLTLVLNSIVNPEKEYKPRDWDKDYRDIDIIQKLDNASRHPNYHAFVDWVMAGLKYPLLGESEADTQRILSKYDKYRKLQSLSERYNRQDYDISSSPTVQYVLSKR